MSRSKLENNYCSVCGRQLSVSDTKHICNTCNQIEHDDEKSFITQTLQEEACEVCIVAKCKTNCLYHE